MTDSDLIKLIAKMKAVPDKMTAEEILQAANELNSQRDLLMKWRDECTSLTFRRMPVDASNKDRITVASLTERLMVAELAAAKAKMEFGSNVISILEPPPFGGE